MNGVIVFEHRRARNRISTLGVGVLLAGVGMAAAQHTEHQAPGTPASAPNQQIVAACIQGQQRASSIAAQLNRRLEAARQTNSAAEMRAAMDDLQAALIDMQAALRACDPLQAAAAASDPHAGHDIKAPAVPAPFPSTQPGTPKPSPGGVQPHAPTPAPTAAIDPVCGMKVDPKTAPKAEHQGKTYYFCSESDRQLFLKNPAKYVKKEIP